jgi:osmotically-inducible protein OsmY
MDTDLKIREDVIAELEFEPSIDAVAIGVGVKDGVVTLSGHVATYAEKIAAETATKRVKGVRALVQDIDVRRAGARGADDESIASRAAAVVGWTAVAGGEGVRVRVEDGIVTLSGEVAWNYQREDIARSVGKLEGVRGVVNVIALHSGVQPRDVSRLIAQAFHRNAELERSTIDIKVEGSKVTLSGKVKAYYERELAERAAWSAPGVVQVVDEIRVV